MPPLICLWTSKNGERHSNMRSKNYNPPPVDFGHSGRGVSTSVIPSEAKAIRGISSIRAGFGEWRNPFARGRPLPQSPIDYPLLFIVVTLVLIGLILVYAATYHLGFRYLKWQLLRGLGGLFALYLGTKINIHRLGQKPVAWVILLMTIALMALTLFFGKVLGVARRQILLFQPQEFAKLGTLIYLAAYFSALKEESIRPSFIKSTLIPGSAVATVACLVLLQPAVGTSLLISISALVVFFLAGVKWRYMLVILSIAGLLGAIGLTTMPLLRNTRYRYIPERWDKFWSGDRYHQTQALIALGSGGPFGRGLGEGRQKYYFIPKLHKDFIFSALGEDFGFSGCFLVMLLYVLFFLRCLRVAERATTEFGMLLSGGIGTMIILYALTHIAVSLSILPTTGQPLPFISYGGSALTSNLLAAGLILNISRYQNPNPLPKLQPLPLRFRS
ncbi:MAG: FtsW/RodA/SpoVE family cell cycle protein [candidate division WOR-3 bacterium]